MRQDSKGACPLSDHDERATALQSTVANRGITRAALSTRGAQKQIPVIIFRLAAMGLVLTVLLLSQAVGRACTVFVLTDTNRVLFCNNEDWKPWKMRIWFVPANKHYGCAYVGLSLLGLSVSEGGFNTEGLAFDWVAGRREKWRRSPKQKITRGVPHERMLESCATVEQAISFYTHHWEPAFRSATMLVADRTGAWATLGAHEGRFEVFRSRVSGGFGYGGAVLGRMLPQDHEATLTNAAQILHAARQEGEYATRYSDVFDPRSGSIFLFLPGDSRPATFNLADELKRGPHFYDMATIDQQRSKKPKRLSPIADWIKVICCPLRYTRPSPSHEPKAALQSPKGCP